MDLVALLNGLIEKLNALQMELADVPAALEKVAKENYDKGFADGVASVPPPESDKVFSQAEVDQMVASAKESLQLEIDVLKGEMEALRGSVESGKQEAVAAFKADLKAKFEASQASESEAEKSFGDLLA